MQPAKQTVSVREAANLAGAGLMLTYVALYDGRLDGRKVDGVWQVDRASVKAWAANRERRPNCRNGTHKPRVARVRNSVAQPRNVQRTAEGANA